LKVNYKQTPFLSLATTRKKEEDLRNMRRHVEVHIDGLSYQCTLCDKTFRSKQALADHRRKGHK